MRSIPKSSPQVSSLVGSLLIPGIPQIPLLGHNNQGYPCQDELVANGCFPFFDNLAKRFSGFISRIFRKSPSGQITQPRTADQPQCNEASRNQGSSRLSRFCDLFHKKKSQTLSSQEIRVGANSENLQGGFATPLHTPSQDQPEPRRANLEQQAFHTTSHAESNSLQTTPPQHPIPSTPSSPYLPQRRQSRSLSPHSSAETGASPVNKPNAISFEDALSAIDWDKKRGVVRVDSTRIQESAEGWNIIAKVFEHKGYNNEGVGNYIWY